MNEKAQSPAKPDTYAPSSPETVKVKGHVPLPGMKAEFGGRKGLEATRYNDWELNGKCVDF
jgi:hypothetical protein